MKTILLYDLQNKCFVRTATVDSIANIIAIGESVLNIIMSAMKHFTRIERFVSTYIYVRLSSDRIEVE